MKKYGSKKDNYIEDLDENYIASIIFTSGTTGKSKGAMITHKNLESNGKALRSIWGFSEDDILLHALPIFHVHGLFVALNTIFLSGAKIIFFEKFSFEYLIKRLPEATVMMGVPTYYSRLLSKRILIRMLVKAYDYLFLDQPHLQKLYLKNLKREQVIKF